jgi:nucleotide-binding universal stress UspA family protein
LIVVSAEIAGDRVCEHRRQRTERETDMFEDVLVGVDGGNTSRDAIALATRLAGEHGRLTLAHVHPGELHPLHAVTPGLLAEERETSEQLLHDERAAAGVDAQLASVVAASPGAGLHHEAERRQADLIVVGSCRRGALGRAMLGDDARAALNGAPCAVAIAARGYAERTKPFATVGVAYNSSPESKAAIAAARTIAAPTHAVVEALEVVTIPTYAYSGFAAATAGEGIETMLAEAGARMAALGDDVRGRAVYGLPGEELGAFSAELDLLVVGSRGYGPVKRLVLGSTSDYLERHARCSLLVLPRGTARAEDEHSSDGQHAVPVASAT